jgi:hypothetical protein
VIVAHHSDTDPRREQQIPVDLTQPLVLEIHSPHGDISIRAVDRSDVLISHDADGHGETEDEAPALTIEAHNNRIEVHPNPRTGLAWAGIGADIDLDTVVGQITKAFRFGGPFFSAKPGKVRLAPGSRFGGDIAVEVPRAMTCRVEVHAASSDLHVEGVTGEIALHTMSGDLHAVRTAGNLEVHAASGDLFGDDVTGRVTVHAASGDVRITSPHSDGFEIQTANGDILVEATLAGDGPFLARTASGDVGLTLRQPAAEGEEPATTLAFHTVSGDAHVTPPFRKTDRRRWQSGTGHRGPHVDVTTVNGDLVASITAKERATVPAPSPADFLNSAPLPPAPPPAPAPDAPLSERIASGVGANQEGTPARQDSTTRLAVLEAVERGEIDVEEALRQLEGEDAVANG